MTIKVNVEISWPDTVTRFESTLEDYEVLTAIAECIDDGGWLPQFGFNEYHTVPDNEDYADPSLNLIVVDMQEGGVVGVKMLDMRR